MSVSHRLPRRLLLAGLLALAAFGRAASAQPAPAVDPAAVRYAVQPCCQLCPAVNDRSRYASGYLEGFSTLVQGKDGWLFRSDDDLRMVFGPDAAGYAELSRLRNALRRRGTELVIVYQPSRGLMHPDKLPDEVRTQFNHDLAKVSYAMTLQRFRQAGVVAPALETLLDDPGKSPYFFRGDHHWTPEGARRTAEVVAKAIRALPVYRELPPKAFVTNRIGVLAKRGTLQKAATMICGHGYTEQYVDRFASGAAEDGDLLGDDTVPQVTLVGTSNSDGVYNFAGFLSEYLGVEVLNESLTGGGFDGPLFRYLPTEGFQKAPPKVLIWELQTYHNMSDLSFYRTAVPLVTDGCRRKTPVLSRTVRVKGASAEALFNGGGQVRDLTGRNYLLDIQFDDPKVEKLKAIVWYADGGKENLSLENSPRIEAKGRFVTELRSDSGWGERTFLSLDILRPDNTPAGVGVKASLCSRDDSRPEPRRVAALKP